MITKREESALSPYHSVTYSFSSEICSVSIVLRIEFPKAQTDDLRIDIERADKD